MTKTWTEKDALELIAKVESEFMAHLTTLEQPLAKSEDESCEEESEEKKDAEKKKKEDESKDKASDDKSGEMAAMDKAETPIVAEPSEEKEIEELYSSMTKAEKDAHYGALKKVMASAEMQKSEADEASVPETKSEDNKEVALIKAEFDAVKASNEELKKANEELKKASEETKKNLDAVVEALKTRFVKKQSAPKQKAITELSALTKSEKTGTESNELSRTEVKKILSEKAKEPTLKKSDRDLINAYCYEKVGVDKIKHLLVLN